MISRLTGTVLAAGEFSVEILPDDSPIAFTVMVPGYYEDHLRARTGHVRTLHTLFTLDGNQNSTTFTPRLIGFPTALDRKFFEMLTTVKGLGSRRALRVLARPPQSVAMAISARDKDSLQTLPEVGKKLAETMIHTLYDPVQGFLATFAGAVGDSSVISPDMHELSAIQSPPPRPAEDDLGHIDAKLRPAIEEAVGALMTLGETRKQATKLVTAAINEVKLSDDESVSSERLLAAAFRQRDG
ncbi:MAG: Holliday junction branch migration protein RuvA [Planctomycetota bacterium]